MNRTQEISLQKQNHLELINTIKKENKELKDQINLIYISLQQILLSNSLNKRKTNYEGDEIDVDRRINLKEENKINELENDIQKEREDKKKIENEIDSIKEEKNQLFQKMNTLNSKVEELQNLISEEKREKVLLEKELNLISNKPKIKKNIFFYSCNFISKKNRKKISIFNIEKNIPIQIEIFFSNDGKNEWPKDTILKCYNDDSEIYFLSYKLTEDNIYYAKRTKEKYTSCIVDLFFKNYQKIEEDEYTLRMCLYSDLKGKIGEEIGEYLLNIID